MNGYVAAFLAAALDQGVDQRQYLLQSDFGTLQEQANAVIVDLIVFSPQSKVMHAMLSPVW